MIHDFGVSIPSIVVVVIPSISFFSQIVVPVCSVSLGRLVSMVVAFAHGSVRPLSRRCVDQMVKAILTVVRCGGRRVLSYRR